jgi:hypothetical protein
MSKDLSLMLGNRISCKSFIIEATGACNLRNQLLFFS